MRGGGCSDQLDRAMYGFGGVYIHRKPGKVCYWRGFTYGDDAALTETNLGPLLVKVIRSRVFGGRFEPRWAVAVQG